MSDLAAVFPPEEPESDTTPVPVATETSPEPANPATSGGFGTFLAQRAKALIAGIGTAAVGELVVVIADPDFQSQVQHAVPAQYAFLTPIVFGLLVGLITHNVPNKPAE